MKNIWKTFWLTVVLSVLFAVAGVSIQLYGGASTAKCSYLDPIVIDMLALLVVGFLIIEGIYTIRRDKNKPLIYQWTRCLRIAIGFGILAVHILQFMHK